MTDSRLLVVMAHPDDETFRCGGTLALLVRQGVSIQVLTATRGEAGSPDPLSPDEGTGWRLRENKSCTAPVRRWESSLPCFSTTTMAS